jgi:Ca2+-transporting ATPase
MAYRVYDGKLKLKDLKMDEVESGLSFLGIASMVDPLREAVPAAMLAAHGAHVRVSIITGDYPTTAEAIAKQAHLAGGKDGVEIIMGEELPGLHDSQISALVERGGVVFSRVAPEDKLRIVEIAKRSGKVVAGAGGKRGDTQVTRAEADGDVGLLGGAERRRLATGGDEVA